MFRAYKLDKSLVSSFLIKSDYERLKQFGAESLKQYKIQIEDTLDGFYDSDNYLDGTKMQSNWFPQIKAHVFLSHSHRDEEQAMYLAGLLKEKANIDVFIDSCVWGYYEELLQMIDDEYCPERDGYSYRKRNRSTSHVHMMLSCALAEMMDRCECVMFMDTPNSITPEDTIKKTESPWIYQEVEYMKLLRHKTKEQHRAILESRHFSNSDIPIKYNIDTSFLTRLDKYRFYKWTSSVNKSKAANANLDMLYNMV